MEGRSGWSEAGRSVAKGWRCLTTGPYFSPRHSSGPPPLALFLLFFFFLGGGARQVRLLAALVPHG